MFVANITPIIIVAAACGLGAKDTAMIIQSAISFKFVSLACTLAATVVTAIGFSRLSVGAASFGGGTGAADFGSANNWILGIVTLVSCILFNILAKGYLKLPHFMPFKIEFNANAIFSFILIFLVSATETIGDTSALASSGLGRDVTEKETSSSIACDGFVSALSSIFGCMPVTSFSQNVGLVAMTKVVNRYAIYTGEIIMVVAGFFPAVGSLLATLPSAVLGGCTIMMFGTIVVSGVQMIGKCGYTQRNITIAALSISIGLGFTQCVTAILLNIILPKSMGEEKVQKNN